MRRALFLVLALACRPEPVDTDSPVLPVDTAPPAGPPALVFDGPAPKNLLFLSIDTLRRDHVDPWGDLALTPFLGRLASEGVVLDDHVQCSNWTFASVTCTLAGRTSVEMGHLPRLNGNINNRPPVPGGTDLLARWLSAAGLYSIAGSSNGWFGIIWGNNQGYTQFLDYEGNTMSGWTDVSTALAEAQTRGEADRFFLHLHALEPHAAYNPPEHLVEGLDALAPWPDGDLRGRDDHYDARDDWSDLTPEQRDLLEAHLRLLYAGEVRHVDALLASVFADADARGWLDDTLVVVWNDHGEQFWEHDNQTHAFTLHGEENDGFAIFWAKNLQPGRWTQPTHAIDIVPTVLDALGMPIPDEVTGRVVGTATDDRLRFTAALARDGGVQAVQQGPWRLHFWWRNGRLALYDRSTDPGETTDLFHPAHPRAIELWDALKPVAEVMATQVLGDTPQPTWPIGMP
ncbi:MAG: arylsulfatase A-like enzyme [Myxococcota bacterium]|jgi:arylsulfatase A-like enzyme